MASFPGHVVSQYFSCKDKYYCSAITHDGLTYVYIFGSKDLRSKIAFASKNHERDNRKNNA